MPAEAPPAWHVCKQIFAQHWGGFPRGYARYATRSYEGRVPTMLACGNPEQMGSLA